MEDSFEQHFDGVFFLFGEIISIEESKYFFNDTSSIATNITDEFLDLDIKFDESFDFDHYDICSNNTTIYV